MVKGVRIIVFSIIAICAVAGCRKENPCTGQSPTTANFTMQDYNSRNNGWIPYVTDTVTGGEVLFTAALDSAQYEWHIGSGVYTSKSFTLNFATAANGSNIPITLIVRKSPNTKCFPTDKGIDTITRNMHISWAYCRVFGTYFGYMLDSPSHKFSITIENAPPPQFYTSFAISSCGIDTVIQTFGWPIIASSVSGYPCGGAYRGIRELIFDVEDTATVASNVQYTTYPLCVAMLDSTYNNITINMTIHKPTPGSNAGLTYDTKFIGVRQ